MIIFNGVTLAKEKEAHLKETIAAQFGSQSADQQGLVIAAILFTQDSGSRLYTKLKSEAASRVGIEYTAYEFSLTDPVAQVQARLKQLAQNPQVTGIIIQKPSRKTWLSSQVGHDGQNNQDFENDASQEALQLQKKAYQDWWLSLTSQIDPQKDVDGLHPSTVNMIASDTWQEQGRVLPATCKAVLTILEQAQQQADPWCFGSDEKYVILGKSDLLGLPLFHELTRRGKRVELLGQAELAERMQSGQKLLDATIIVSATGKKNIVTADMIQPRVVVVDVGEPKPDVDFAAVAQKASFITPVPGGVGPLTVVSLLENCVELATKKFA